MCFEIRLKRGEPADDRVAPRPLLAEPWTPDQRQGIALAPAQQGHPNRLNLKVGWAAATTARTPSISRQMRATIQWPGPPSAQEAEAAEHKRAT
jgi:hypothetical protein